MTTNDLFNLKFKSKKNRELFFKELLENDEILKQIIQKYPEKILESVFFSGFVLGLEDRDVSKESLQE